MTARTRKNTSGNQRTSGEAREENPRDPEPEQPTAIDDADAQPSAPADGPDLRPAYRPGMEPK